LTMSVSPLASALTVTAWGGPADPLLALALQRLGGIDGIQHGWLPSYSRSSLAANA